MHTLEQLRCGQLAGIRRLQLSCALTEFPREIFDLADTLEILDLSGNALSALPDDLPRLGKLRIVFCSDNRFTELPAVLGACAELSMIGFKANRIERVPAASLPAKLRWLVLTDNRIEALPASIGRCTQLQKLMLAGNRLRALPAEMAACTRLELLRIAANRLSELPAWLLALPRLSWLAYAGNPCAATNLPGAPHRAIAWQRLQLQQQLGEGASGVIHQARQDGAQTVAVKLFKGAVTSDGLPGAEMAACIGAGEHPNLIPVLGQLSEHPGQAQGLVMRLIDPGFGNLAGPPSLDSCTRDVYPAGKRFDLAAKLGIAHGIASAVHHLHRRGILHGDLYGHNILHCEQGRSLLGDFGAASFFDPDGAHAGALQRLEARAFGCLLEELIARSDAPASARPALDQLSRLSADCLHAEGARRPLFGEIERRLADLKRAHSPRPQRED
ncbi:leucine-rich repeat-containing protein kinase family protein [Rugamonas sp. DEMB1]|uniref:leucine-rich repeat-containing protein kinase family protein n=1 Tax=Rugamonas sp. DEMB1 TaxID=3039386 RepID=UPI00244937BC|nr:leucine-rich repeat-containing protein kinase family protein [Rugamonas sp. DEMB1]WGG49487.1 leucine-rich repeat-containing protein kinase family protein [Rugamonas sp. DEMB1]